MMSRANEIRVTIHEKYLDRRLSARNTDDFKSLQVAYPISTKVLSSVVSREGCLPRNDFRSFL